MLPIRTGSAPCFSSTGPRKKYAALKRFRNRCNLSQKRLLSAASRSWRKNTSRPWKPRRIAACRSSPLFPGGRGLSSGSFTDPCAVKKPLTAPKTTENRVREGRFLPLRSSDYKEVFLCCTAPVSYTHLDVYKRQAHIRSGCPQPDGAHLYSGSQRRKVFRPPPVRPASCGRRWALHPDTAFCCGKNGRIPPDEAETWYGDVYKRQGMNPLAPGKP